MPNGKTPMEHSPTEIRQMHRSKLRGMDRDSPQVRMSKTVSWILRHGAKKEGLPIREDGYLKVSDLLDYPKFKSHSLDFITLQEIVRNDNKQRFDLTQGTEDGVWWIRANQGHSISAIKVDLKPILSAFDISSGIIVHGTSKVAWQSISKEGLSRMKRNHIHFAQGVSGDDNVISGMRNSSQILIFINLQKALDAGINFFLSDNGVVLTEGNKAGILGKEFFLRVEDSRRVPLPVWEGALEIVP